MTQPNVPDRPREGLPPSGPDPPVTADAPPPANPDAATTMPDALAGPPAEAELAVGEPAAPPSPPPPTEPTPAPVAAGTPAAAPAPPPFGPPFASPARAARRSVTARLLLLLPILTGVLLVEGIFAERGRPGDVVSLPAAGLAFLLAWLGVAWALRSWLVPLMTLVPAIMVTLGAAMVGGLATGAGAALILVGLALIGAVVSFRLSNPARAWSPGWWLTPSTDGSTAAPAGLPPLPTYRPAAPVEDADGGGRGHGSTAAAGPASHPADPGGAHPPGSARSPTWPDGSVPPASPGPADRPAPAWDTSHTNQNARDRLVAVLCRRGGAAGPTLATLEEFFTGNGDPRSIAPGLRGAVPLTRFHDVLHRIREHRAVSELLVQVEPLQPGRYPAGEWPLAGSVHVIATLSADEVDALMAELRAQSAIGPLPVTSLSGGGRAPAASGEFAVWWE